MTVHIFDHLLHSDLFGVADRPDRREAQAFSQRRFDNEKRRTA